MIPCLEGPKLDCPMVFGLSSLSLSTLGKPVQGLQDDFLKSSSFDPSRNFFVDRNNSVCTARNSIMAFSLFSSGLEDISKAVVDSLLGSSLFRENHFVRSSSDESLVVHSNLWAVLAFIQQGRVELARKIFSFLDAREFASVDCKTGESKVFSDDLALAAVASWFLDERERALEILSKLRKDFFDSEKRLFCRSSGEKVFSTYKNAFCVMASRVCGFEQEADHVAEALVRELQDVDGRFVQTDLDNMKLSDNTLLALVACQGKTVFDGLNGGIKNE